MIKLTKLLKERKQVGDVYHFTAILSIFKILDSNLLKSAWSTRNFSQGKMTGFNASISTTRDKNFSKSRLGTNQQIGGDDFAIMLDGNRMSDKYRSIPYNDAFNPEDTDINNKNYSDSYGDEMEQLWYGPEIEKGGIKNIKTYIKKIILTKSLINKLTFLPNATIGYFPKDFQAEYKDKWASNSSSTDRINDIINYIESMYNIPVETEK